MPLCSRISDFTVSSSHSQWNVAVDTPLSLRDVNFENILINSIVGARLISTEPTGQFPSCYQSHFSIPKGAINENDLKKFLKILKWTVSISDTADESHALYLHSLPKPTFDKTRMGTLVNKAKSYSPSTGNKPAALKLAERMEYWILRHPRYRASDVIIPAPAGNPDKAFDLPLYIAEYLSATVNYVLGVCKKVHPISQQKSLEQNPEILRNNVTGKFKLDTHIRGNSVIILDDIYQSGETLHEVARACRAAGAKTVLSLTATKTAKFCNGLAPSEWYEVSMEAEKANDE